MPNSPVEHNGLGNAMNSASLPPSPPHSLPALHFPSSCKGLPICIRLNGVKAATERAGPCNGLCGSLGWFLMRTQHIEGRGGKEKQLKASVNSLAFVVFFFFSARFKVHFVHCRRINRTTCWNGLIWRRLPLVGSSSDSMPGVRAGFFDMTNLPDCLKIVRAIPPQKK